jgi:hypothetical protein
MLISTVKKTCKQKNGEEYRTDWVAIAALFPVRTKDSCKNRRRSALDSKSDKTIVHVGKWTKDEDSTLKEAVTKHHGKNWEEISALVTGRTKKQSMSRWHGALESKSEEMTAHVGKWTKEEDSTLKDAVEKHNYENWAAISALVPGRTKQQCVG